jgi:hypothetical protein
MDVSWPPPPCPVRPPPPYPLLSHAQSCHPPASPINVVRLASEHRQEREEVEERELDKRGGEATVTHLPPGQPLPAFLPSATGNEMRSMIGGEMRAWEILAGRFLFLDESRISGAGPCKFH